jgi:hypothetical protein
MPHLFHFLVLLIPNYENLDWIEPLTIRMLASFANHYTNMTYLKTINKKYNFLPMGFMF